MLYGRLFGSIHYCLVTVEHLNFSSGKKKKKHQKKNLHLLTKFHLCKSCLH